MIDFTLAELLTGLDLEEPTVQLGGFPYDCFEHGCIDHNDCLLNGCLKGPGTPPRLIKAASPSDESSVAKDEAEADKPKR